MLWLYVPGSGWVLQPAAPALPGCVITPRVPRGFGFTRVARWTAVVATALGLAWLWEAGHATEVAGAVLAAVLGEVLSEPARRGFGSLRGALPRGLRGGEV
ncbi:hypothetical protein ACFWUZ_28910 [Streptomyces sp. NPDC058646]|uniref:hypothetical protein n=1 Tax=Streptomyces sp. NPDC058646 TaxID=3346574 RepID=UPI003649C5A9